MANLLKLEKQVAVISGLVEGASVRSIERMTGVHRDTILRLMVRVAESAAAFSDATLRDLDCHRIECDEIWAYVAKKQRNVEGGDDRTRVGDQYTFVALDPDRSSSRAGGSASAAPRSPPTSFSTSRAACETASSYQPTVSSLTSLPFGMRSETTWTTRPS